MNRLIVPDLELRLEVPDPLDVGDELEVVRVDGLGEGDRLGVATCTGFDRGGYPELDVHLEVVMSGPGTAGYTLEVRQHRERGGLARLLRRRP